MQNKIQYSMFKGKSIKTGNLQSNSVLTYALTINVYNTEQTAIINILTGWHINRSGNFPMSLMELIVESSYWECLKKYLKKTRERLI